MLFWLCIYLIFAALTHFLMICVLSKAHLKNHKRKDILEKFAPFNRKDVDHWFHPSVLTVVTFWPRFLLAVCNLALYCIWVCIVMIGVDLKNPKIGPTRLYLLKSMGKLSCRLQLLLAGVVWIQYEEMKDADYKKWLGPDWEPQWQGSGTLVFNHVCWMDILAALCTFYPSFVSKKSIQKFPFIGTIATAIDSVFLDRAGSKEEKKAAAKQIEWRQQENEITDRPPLLIFPEGATTNNDYLVKFKRGPFGGLSSVQPVCLKYWSPFGISPQNDTIGQSHFYYCLMSPCFTLHMKVYPVFKPNDYFWANHWDEKSGKDKWEAYARVVREEIMAKSFNFILSDIQMEDKLQFKALMKGKSEMKDD